MSQLKRTGPFSGDRPEWQENLPRGLRLAAEWQFGTVILGSLIGAIRGDLVGLPVGVLVSFVLFLFLSARAGSRRIDTPGLWWAVVITLSVLGAIGAIAAVVVDQGT